MQPSTKPAAMTIVHRIGQLGMVALVLLCCSVTSAQMPRITTGVAAGPTLPENPSLRTLLLHWEAVNGLHPTDHYQIWLKTAALTQPDAPFTHVADAVAIHRPEAIVGAMKSEQFAPYVAGLASLLGLPITDPPAATELKSLADTVLEWLAKPHEHGFSTSSQFGRINPIAGWILGETSLVQVPPNQTVALKLTDADGRLLGLVEIDTSTPTTLQAPLSLLGSLTEQQQVALELPAESVANLRQESPRIRGIQIFRYTGTWSQPWAPSPIVLPQLLKKGFLTPVGNPVPLDSSSPSEPLHILDPLPPTGTATATYWAAAQDVLGQTGLFSPEAIIVLTP